MGVNVDQELKFSKHIEIQVKTKDWNSYVDHLNIWMARGLKMYYFSKKQYIHT